MAHSHGVGAAHADVARSVYQGVLDRVERIGFDVFRHRASLPPWELGGAAWRALRAA